MSDPGQPPPGGWQPIRPDQEAGPAPSPWEPPLGSTPPSQAPPPPPPPPTTVPSTGGSQPPPPSPWDAAAAGAPPPPPTAPPPIPPPSYGVPAAGGGVGGGAASGPAPKRIRPASMGRRPPIFALVGGLGLLGLLITVAILALLANRVLSGTDDAAEVLTGELPSELTTTTAPGATTVPGEEPGGGVTGLTDPAVAATCQVNRLTLETAIRVYELTTGSPPPDQQALVDAAVLAEPITTHELSAGPAGVQITGVGDCAGQ